MIHQDLRDAGKIEELMASSRSMETGNAELAEKTRTEDRLFRKERRAHALPEFRRPGLFVGTGVIEAGCKTVIGSRCKQSGCSGRCVGPTPSSLCELPIQRPL
jgi:hypothetical protein